ncbi:hypothetical protein HD554DRAFT_2024276, partial [Boletus coccyginus]
VQPFSVPCERAFSSSGLMDTKQCNQINPVFMKTLQILKFSFKREQPSLKWWMTLQQEMLCDEDSSQVLASIIPGCGNDNGVDEVLKVIMIEEGESLPGHVDVY